MIQNVADDVRRRLLNEGSGHDWWHVYRVWQMARQIAIEEGADLEVVELAALVHDIADWKFHGGDESVGPKTARVLLAEHGFSDEAIVHVCGIMLDMSFKGAGVPAGMRTLEGKIVQDADRLDAIGAIGIARCFAYGGYKGQLLHDPEHRPVLHRTKEEYLQRSGTSVGHFYEKLLLLKDRMNTETARRIAEERHRFMEAFLERFYREWDGEL